MRRQGSPYYLRGKDDLIWKLREVDDLTFGEIGELLGASRQAIHQRYMAMVNKKAPDSNMNGGATQGGGPVLRTIPRIPRKAERIGKEN